MAFYLIIMDVYEADGKGHNYISQLINQDIEHRDRVLRRAREL